ncbi:MAG: hypothetical protein J7647_06150 [Cyanobacteria bacterium SBLK]|nr:hypothetical protein [Cyanobacteria bacterium SBLK]
MKGIRHWKKALAVLVLLWGSVGEGRAIASPSSQSYLSRNDSQLNIATNRVAFQLAQVNDDLGREGECRAVKRETALYGANSIRAITGIYLNTNDVVQLLEDNRRGQRLIAVFLPQLNISGYVETSELKICPLAAFVQPQFPNNPIPQQPNNPFPQAPQLSSSASQCEITRATYLYEAPGFDSKKRVFLEVEESLEIEPGRSGMADNFQWIYVSRNSRNLSSRRRDSGWIIVDSVGCREFSNQSPINNPDPDFNSDPLIFTDPLPLPEL